MLLHPYCTSSVKNKMTNSSPLFDKISTDFHFFSPLHTAGELLMIPRHLNCVATLPCEILLSKNAACPYMLGTVLLKITSLRPDVWQATVTVVTEASHMRNRFHRLGSQIDKYHPGVAQFRHAVCHCRSARRQRLAPT